MKTELGMGSLHIENLRKEFDNGESQIVAVNDLNIDIVDGEFLVLVGPSGCGKSTTLRCVAGLETPTSGEIRLDGEDVTERKPKERNMAMVFQNYALYPHMTARQNIGFGLKMTANMSKAEIDDKVEETAEMMGIEDLLEKKPGELSGGQQQRVALGRAIVRDPEVFLMDEPLSNLDAKLRTQMRTELQNIQQNLNVTTMYVTHDQTEAMTMGDHIVVLDGGELQQIGTPLECYHQPANQFVAGFIGSPSMNFFSAVVDGRTLVHDSFDYTITEDLHGDLGDVTEVTLGIRPEDIVLADENEKNAFTFPVDVVEPLGDVSYVYLDIEGVQYTASFDGDVIIDEGNTLPVRFPEERLHVFDAKTGTALRNRKVSEGDTATINPERL